MPVSVNLPNEIILAVSLLLCFGGVVFAYWLWGLSGLNCFTVFASITANIEVLITIVAFGMEQTLGNVLFASTFLVTDIISEMYSKKEAQRASLFAVRNTSSPAPRTSRG